MVGTFLVQMLDTAQFARDFQLPTTCRAAFTRVLPFHYQCFTEGRTLKATLQRALRHKATGANSASSIDRPASSQAFSVGTATICSVIWLGSKWLSPE